MPPPSPSAAVALEGTALPPASKPPTSLETEVQALIISDPPKLPDSFRPAPVTVVRSTPPRPPLGQVPLTSLPSATPPTSLPGMPTQQFSLPSGAPPTTQVSLIPRMSEGLAAAGLPLAPPTISLPTVAQTISLSPTPSLIPASAI